MERRIFSLCLIFIVLLWPPHLYGQQEVKIRIVNAKDGQPLKDQLISVSLLYDNSDKASAKVDSKLSLKTDINGQALAHIPESAPEHLGVTAHLTSQNWRCACLALAVTQEVIHNGLTVPDATNKSAGSVANRAKPGEILFIARPLSFIERILEPFLRQ